MSGVYFHGEVAAGDNSTATAFTLYLDDDGTPTSYTLGSADVVVITDVSALCGASQTGKVIADEDTAGELVCEVSENDHNVNLSTGYRCSAGVTPKYLASGGTDSECVITGYIELG